MQARSLSQEEPLQEGLATHSSILPGEPHGQRSLAGYGPQGHKESDTTEAAKQAIQPLGELLIALHTSAQRLPFIRSTFLRDPCTKLIANHLYHAV